MFRSTRCPKFPPAMNQTALPKWKFILLLTVYGIIIVAALLGSYFVLRAFHKSRKLRTASNNILVSLSIADGLLAIPSILDIIQLSLEYNSGHPSHILKDLSGTFTLLLLSVIALHLTLMSVERFIAIKFPSRYHTVTKRRARIISIMMWLWAMVVVVALPEVLQRISGHEDLRKIFSTTSQVFRIRWRLVFTAALMFLVPLLIILCTNVYIFTVSYKQRQHVRGRDTLAMPIIIHDKKVVRLFITVVALCLLSIIPMLVVTSLRALSGKSLGGCKHQMLLQNIVYDVAMFVNAIFNPLIFRWKIKNSETFFARCWSAGELLRAQTVFKAL